MQRTQIYLTDEEQAAIKNISIRSGTSQSALIRKAIDQFIALNTTGDKANKRLGAFGLWQDHENLPDLAEIRAEERFTE
ncbi:MAG: CopG family transcriptional regulator [Methyloglobulus sp.]|nr:CopG family transcriptional regulator [Methyloglobulus sp.]